MTMSRIMQNLTGKHSVLRGPKNTDIFEFPSESEERMSVSEEILKEGKNIQVSESVLRLL